jgi:hypothetical protein
MSSIIIYISLFFLFMIVLIVAFLSMAKNQEIDFENCQKSQESFRKVYVSNETPIIRLVPDSVDGDAILREKEIARK